VIHEIVVDLFVFVLATFAGAELISKVPQTLHTPLMSGSNAISGITVVGALLASSTDSLRGLAPVLGCAAIVLAQVNVVGGFAVTDRMLKMFKRR
jgi:NAD(P) transhydrogenase subunit alpha